MLAIAIATAALLAFSATAEVATTKYDYGGREKYKHEYHGSYKPYYKHGAYEREHMRGDGGYEDYSYKPSYTSPYADREYREPRHDSHDEDHYDRDVYLEEKKVKRSAREGQFFGHGLGLGLGQLKKIGNSDARVHIHIFTGQGQAQDADQNQDQAQVADADSASQSDADSNAVLADQDQAQVADADSASQSDADSNAVLAAELENENLAVDFFGESETAGERETSPTTSTEPTREST